MPKGEETVRKYYFEEGRDHPNRKRKVKTGFEGNNWPSTRTFYSDIPVSAVALSLEFQFYLYKSSLLATLEKREAVVFLEKISREMGCYLSNYTIDGLLNEKWGVRHNPTDRTIRHTRKIIEYLKKLSKKVGRYEEFDFKLHEKHKATIYELKNYYRENRKKSSAKRRKSKRTKVPLRPEFFLKIRKQRRGN